MAGYMCMCIDKGKICSRAKSPIRLKLIPVFVA